MLPDESESLTYDARLLAGLPAYGFINVAGVYLAAVGIVHQPRSILNFFTFVGPAFGIVGVIAVQAFCSKRPFTWLAVVGGVLAMALAAYINFQALRSASAAV